MAYSFQVAAQNSFGVGSFSNSVIILYGSQGNHYIIIIIIMHIDYYADTNCTIRNFDSGMDF